MGIKRGSKVITGSQNYFVRFFGPARLFRFIFFLSSGIHTLIIHSRNKQPCPEREALQRRLHGNILSLKCGVILDVITISSVFIQNSVEELL